MIETIIASLIIGVFVVSFPIQNKRITDIVFGIYILAVLCVTLLTRDDSGFGQMHLIPLEQVVYWMKRYYQAYGLGRMFKPLFGLYLNVLLFVPFGFLLHLPAWKTILFGFLFSLAIETVQLFTGLGMFEMDDLLTNTLGAWLGALIYSFLIISKSAVKQLYPFYDENIFLFYEEVYLGNKTYILSIPTYYVKDIVIDHKEDGSMRISNVNLRKESHKSVVYYYEHKQRR